MSNGLPPPDERPESSAGGSDVIVELEEEDELVGGDDWTNVWGAVVVEDALEVDVDVSGPSVSVTAVVVVDEG